MKHKVRHIHFVGIGGVGMSGIAEVLINLGYQISGSDKAQTPVTERLKQLGAQIFHEHRAENIRGANVVVTSTAVTAQNPEVLAAIEQGVVVVPRAMMLAELMRFRSGIAIAGTHGKTTTTSLAVSILAASGLDPTFVIGGRLEAAGSNARLGSGEYLVAEADESDASFLHLMPIMAVVTNIDVDHMDTYGHDVSRLHQAFIDFLHRLPFYGRAILCLDDAGVREILPKLHKPITTYGLSKDAQVRAENVRAEGQSMFFDVVWHELREGSAGQVCEPKRLPVRLNLPGKHNVLNALAAVAVGLECGATAEGIVTALAEFAGVGRRFQRYGDIALPRQNAKLSAGSMARATVIDDYGHHPAEMQATIEAARGAFPNRRLVLVFQPHRYTRTRDLFEDFVAVLSQADMVVLTEVYAAGEAPIVAADSRALARALRVLGQIEPIFADDLQSLPALLLQHLLPEDVVIMMGAGSIGSVAARLVELAKG